MKKILLSSITPGTTIWYECYGERGELLLTPGTVIMPHHLQRLRERNIFELYLQVPSQPFGDTTGKKAPRKTAATPAEQTLPAPQSQDQKANPESPPARAFAEEYEHIRAEKLNELLKSPAARQLDLSIRRGRQFDRPVGVKLSNSIRPAAPLSRTPSYKQSVLKVYAEMLAALREFLTTLLTGRSIDIAPIRKAASQLLNLFIDDPDIVLALSAIKPAGEDYICGHMLNTCILSMGIAAASLYNREQVLTIAIGALLHDIGMPLVPSEIRDKTGALSPREFSEIKKHPVMGILMVDKIRHLPDPIRYILYQSHERENGTGYPQQRSSQLIHRYAKVIQIADVFEALTSPRKHRGAYTPFESMEMVIRMGQRGFLAPHFVKSFLAYTSLFPVGSIVELSDHRLARVVHANPSMFHRPVVSIVQSDNGKLLGEQDIYQLDLSYDESLSVIRALPPASLPGGDLMKGF